MTDPAATGSLLEDRLEIETPERVTISYDLAGIGSRFAAGVIDAILLGFVVGVLGSVLVIVTGLTAPHGAEAFSMFVMACLGVLWIVVSVYYTGFEWLWSGQTPGKRLLRIRVVSQHGTPAPAGAIFLRNLLRIVDVLPGVAPYGLGGVVMFVNRRSKRIGDYAAGTIVVRERAVEIAALAPPSSAALPGEALAEADLARVRAFVARAPQMIAASRADVARRLAAELAARHGLAVGDAEEFLRLLASGRMPGELRAAQGPAA